MIDLITLILLENYFMICNQNEKYLLKFISNEERELITNRLSEIFAVSKQMAAIRLNKFLLKYS